MSLPSSDTAPLPWDSASFMAAMMRRARCLVFPSLWYETFGLVVGDALRVGLPVLVSSSCVAADMVDHERSGLHLPAGDVDAWAAAMTRMSSDDLVRRMGDAALASGARFLDPEDHGERLVGIYRKALTRKAQAAASNRRAAT